MQTVALTTGEHATEFLLIGTGEVEARQVGTGVDVPSSHADEVVTAGDYLIYTLIGIDIFMLLVYVGHLYSLSYFELALIYRFQAHDKAEKSGLTGTVRTDDTNDTVGRKHEVEVIEQQFVAECFCYVLGFDNFVAQTGTVGYEDFQFFFFLLHIFIQQPIVGVQTGFTFCLTSFGCHTYPFQLAFQRLAALAGSLFFLLHAFGFLFQPTGVVAFPGNAFATVQFENPACYMVQKVTVVRHGNHCTFVLLQVLFQPVDGLGIEVVGRLVEQQHVRLL